MKVKGWTGILAAAFLLLQVGCDKKTGPDPGGVITLSSQLHGTDSYYLYGFSFENGEMFRYPHQGDPLPDIINEGYLVIDGAQQISLPGFNTPGQVNGFALVGAFSTLNDANAFFQDYATVEEGLQFETLSDTVKLYQVWVQQTSAGKFVKMVIQDIKYLETDTGAPYSDVSLEYIYASDGSTGFSCGCD